MSKFKSSDRIRRAKHEKNYTVILNATIQDSRLSWKARGLHHYILSLPDDWDICIAHLSEQSLNDGMAIVKSALKELETFGYLSKVRLKDDRGRFLKCVWDIYETPQVDKPQVDKPQVDKPQVDKPQVDKPQVDKPQVDKPQVDKPQVGNQPLTSNDQPSTNLLSTEETSKERENTNKEGYIFPPTANFPEPCQPTKETLIAGMAKEETPISPTPLASLPPENICLAIAETVKPKRRTVELDDQENFRPFLIVWNQTVPSHWERYERLTVEMVNELKKFTKGKKAGTLEIFEEGLLEVSGDPFLGSTKCEGWRFCSYFTNNKPRKYSGYYREKQFRSQQLQSNTDRPMTASEIRKAETYLKYKEALTA
jgi:hypothetical protein